MSYYRHGNSRPRPHLVTADDIGTHVTLALRKPGAAYVSGVVQGVSATHVTIGVMHYPTGPWDRWEPYEAPATIEHRRILRRA